MNPWRFGEESPMRRFSRRQVMTGAAGAAIAVAATPPAAAGRIAGDAILKYIPPRITVIAAATPTVTRQSLGSLAPDDPILQSYRTAIERMKALPETDPRNWTRQARIHEDFCPHSNWLFLPWHRAYLAAFERIIRQMSGNE